ncbi:MAG: 50S ribosomal protein L21 [bacterium]|nr:50S ribosomal protein L21 [bacterium]
MNIAVVKTGGKQYLVKEGSVITIEKLLNAKKDGTVSFDSVLLTDDGSETHVGTPSVSGAKVSATVLEEGRGKKIVVVKYKAKSRYFKKRGHRQPFTKVKIGKI